jgi:hypothetical protein
LFWQKPLAAVVGIFQCLLSNYYLATNRVNSREVRRVVEEIIDESEVKPSTIRFFRGAMFNMVSKSALV